MNRIKSIFVLSLLSLPLMAQDNASDNQGPTMGWSSWNTYGLNISEQLIRKQTAAIISKGLKDVGYDHINIDDGYFGGRDEETGQLLIHPTRFPNGLKGIVDYIHSKGLKAGIYSDAGHSTCGCYHGGDKIAANVGLYEHDQQDADFFFKELGFDFIKVDFCGGDPIHNEARLKLDERERYTSIAQAIKNTGRTDVRMNACRWAYPGTWISDVAFSWRTTGDIYDGWNSVKGILHENLYLSAYCHDGRYNDMDMLEVGRSMSNIEDQTHFGMWCIMSSPLLIGCDMTSIKAATLSLLKNKELVALNQDPLHLQAYVCQRSGDCYVLVKDVEVLNGNKRAFAVYNPSDEEQTVEVDFSKMELAGTIQLRDLFKKKEAGSAEGTLSVTVPAHGTTIYSAVTETRTERTLYEAETAFNGTYQEITNNQTMPSGTYDEVDYASGGCKVGWLGNSADNYLEWRNVHSASGGRYRLTLGYISGESRSLVLYVNGQRIQNLSNLNSGGWNKVGTRSVEIRLNAGQNTIRIANSSAWMPDMDYMRLELLEADAIESVSKGRMVNGKWYDLSGRPTIASKKGIKIRKGHKVLKREP